MRKLLLVVALCAALVPSVAVANHEVPDPNPTVGFVLDRAKNNTPSFVGVWLHLDRTSQTWRVDCDSPAPFPDPEHCPLLLDGTLDLDPHYGPLTDPGCSVPAGTGGEGRADLWPFIGLAPGRLTPADLRGVHFARTPVTATGTQFQGTVLHLEGEWFDEHGRADRMEAVFRASGTGQALCGADGVAHLTLAGHVWLMGVVR